MRFSIIRARLRAFSVMTPASLCSEPGARCIPPGTPGMTRGETPSSVNAKRLYSPNTTSPLSISLPRSMRTESTSSGASVALLWHSACSVSTNTGSWYFSARLNAVTASSNDSRTVPGASTTRGISPWPE